MRINNRPILALLLPAALVVSIAPAFGATKGKRLVSAANNTVTLAIAAEHQAKHSVKAVYGLLQPVIIDAKITNGSNRWVIFGVTEPLAVFQYHVTTEAGKTVELTSFGKHALDGQLHSTYNDQMRLKPGTSATFRYTINRLYDMSQAGTYTVAFTKEINLADLDTNVVSKRTIKSNTVCIQVDEDPSVP